MVNYTEQNVTSWIWPNYIPEINAWEPILPEYILAAQFSYHIGTNISSVYSFVPFESCQNAKFIIRACLNNPLENNTWSTPVWISMDQQSNTFNLDIGKVNSVGIYQIYLQAQLIAHSLNLYNNEFYYAINSSTIEFTNENAKFIESTTTWNIVIDQTKSFILSFYDIEGDSVQVKLISNKGVNTFIQNVSITNYSLVMLWDNSTLK